MPHDKHGHLIEAGDLVRTAWGSEHKVDEVIAGADSCNLKITVASTQYLNARDVEVLPKAVAVAETHPPIAVPVD